MKVRIKYSLVIILLVVFIGLQYWHILFYQNNYEISQKKTFPDKITSWVSEDVIYDKDALESLDPDVIVYKNYRKQAGIPVTLFIAMYNNVEKADLSHSPIVCFTGQGWIITDTSEDDISIDVSENRTIKVNKIIQKKSGTIMITLYWYESIEHSFSNRGIQKVYLFVNKMLGKSSRNAFVRVIASIPAEGDIKELETDLYQFTHDFYPDLRWFLSDD